MVASGRRGRHSMGAEDQPRPCFATCPIFVSNLDRTTFFLAVTDPDTEGSARPPPVRGSHIESQEYAVDVIFHLSFALSA